MVLLDFSVTPLGKGESVSPYVARCLEVAAASGLDYWLHAMGTTVEGELDQVLDVVRRYFEALQPDRPRINCSVKIDYRNGPGSHRDSKVKKVQDLAGRPLNSTSSGPRRRPSCAAPSTACGSASSRRIGSRVGTRSPGSFAHQRSSQDEGVVRPA